MRRIFFRFFFMHSFCQTRLLTLLHPFGSIVLGEERRERERERHTPAGEEGWCPLLLPVLLGLQSVSKGEPRRTATAQQGSRRNRQYCDVCDFVILLQLHRSVTCSDSLLSSQVSNCLPQLSDSSPVFVSLFFFWLFVLELLL